MAYGDNVPFSALVGKTLTAVTQSVGAGVDQIIFEAADGESFRMYHSQDCCESVNINDINGSLDDLIGAPILFAEENSSGDRPEGVPLPEYTPASQTWTFYRIGTVKGTVVIRWFGESSGYYSESVDFERVS